MCDDAQGPVGALPRHCRRRGVVCIQGNPDDAPKQEQERHTFAGVVREARGKAQRCDFVRVSGEHGHAGAEAADYNAGVSGPAGGYPGGQEGGQLLCKNLAITVNMLSVPVKAR